ncbi:hypothetical protein IE81DRAFT_332657 [Ceraceosorus guamensis]|uniref:Uncharacterized protein n=1 Tax=Ceraceosorus guamensis TaxID=1522189 RepID=A0A316VS12_9BASI|nr:hypothetical protein IE81DRAFT_332657 [Ceraceosorus guamensis]PWN38971.1 hypothetical protein IE81DRAFT_332657 [Ceraceosorus guamensis]
MKAFVTSLPLATALAGFSFCTGQTIYTEYRVTHEPPGLNFDGQVKTWTSTCQTLVGQPTVALMQYAHVDGGIYAFCNTGAPAYSEYGPATVNFLKGQYPGWKFEVTSD